MARVDLLSLLLAGCTCGDDGGTEIVCGDRQCSAIESCETCAADCPCICGDGLCSEASCESCSRCPADCGACREVACSCGDGLCDGYHCGESCAPCPEDCGRCPEDDGSCAGDAACDAGACPADSGACEGACGDGVCATSESWEGCSDDCGGPAQGAFRPGDGHCEPGDAPGPDCAGSTCDEDCTTSCDCDQPWTVCSVEVGAAWSACVPVSCADCFRDGRSCSYASGTCNGASCEDL